MKFRKKPVVIHATQFFGTEDSVAVDCPPMVRHFVVMKSTTEGNFIPIDTLEGTMKAMPGDWIICGVKGEFYPCKDDIFRATYDPAE